VNELGTTVLNTLLPPLSDSADGLGDFVTSIDDFINSEAFTKRLNTIKSIFKDLKPEIRLVAGALLELTDPETLEGIGSVIDGLIDLFITLTALVDPVIEAFRLLDAFDADKFETAEPGSQNPFVQAGTAPQQNAKAVQSPGKMINANQKDTEKALQPVRAGYNSQFSNIREDIIGNSIIPNMFTDIAQFIRGPATKLLGKGLSVFASSFIAVFESMANTAFNIVGRTFTDILNLIIDTVEALPDAITEELPFGVSDVGQLQFQERQTDIGQLQQQRQQEIQQTIEVVVEGDTSVVKDTAARVVQEEADAAKRATGGTQRP
jgi:hypothetical protein